MYFWKTGDLANDIKNDEVPDHGWKNYFLAWSIIGTLSMYLVSIAPHENMDAMLVEMIGLVGITIFGISKTFGTNIEGGGTAQNYFSRSIALSVPLLVKFTVLSFFAGIVLGIAEGALSLPASGSQWALCALVLGIQILYFWRINVHLAYINT